jgi:hypothetical protein
MLHSKTIYFQEQDYIYIVDCVLGWIDVNSFNEKSRERDGSTTQSTEEALYTSRSFKARMQEESSTQFSWSILASNFANLFVKVAFCSLKEE